MYRSTAELGINRRKKKPKIIQPEIRPLVQMLKQAFRTKMAEFAKQASQIEDEKFRTTILNLIGSLVRSLPEYRRWDELFEFVESYTDTVRIGISSALYGPRDARTQQLFKLGEARAMDRAMQANDTP